MFDCSFYDAFFLKKKSYLVKMSSWSSHFDVFFYYEMFVQTLGDLKELFACETTFIAYLELKKLVPTM